VDHVAVVVADDLDLDVPGRLDVALDDHRPVTERPLGLGGRRVERGCELVAAADDPDALASTAGGGLDEDRVADLVGRGD
jgi:hypothetical protein